MPLDIKRKNLFPEDPLLIPYAAKKNSSEFMSYFSGCSGHKIHGDVKSGCPGNSVRWSVKPGK